LAGTFVNAFVNAGFGNDKLLVEADEGNSWIYKNKDHGTYFFFQLVRTSVSPLAGMLSATASLGLSLLWDTDIGLSHVDKYTYSSEENIKVRRQGLITLFILILFSGGSSPRHRYPQHWRSDRSRRGTRASWRIHGKQISSA
jgi:hypothetical protein